MQTAVAADVDLFHFWFLSMYSAIAIWISAARFVPFLSTIASRFLSLSERTRSCTGTLFSIGFVGAFAGGVAGLFMKKL
jgi:hypothetical protein